MKSVARVCPGRSWRCLCLFLISLPLTGLAGCGGYFSSATTPDAPAGAEDILERMTAAYKKARTYADSGTVRLRFEQGDKRVDDSVDFSVTFERPNRLRMHLYQAILVSDGEQLRGTLADVPGQVLSQPAPASVTLKDLYSIPAMGEAISQGAAGGSLPLALLVEDGALAEALKDAEKPQLLSADEIGGRACHRIQIKRPDGVLVFWIDQETLVVRRMEYPIEGLRRQMEEQPQAPGQDAPKVSSLSLVADFTGARLDTKIDGVAFQFEMPEGAQLVESFDIREPLPPLLGQELTGYRFVGLAGQEVGRAEMAGKVVVIDFWATWCKWCFEGLPNLEGVYQQYKDNDNVMFLAVSTDEENVLDKELHASFTKAQLTLPIYRDKGQYARKVFAVDGLPTTIILGPDGTVQDYERGYRPNLATEMPAKLDKLLAGVNLAEEALADFRRLPAASGEPQEIPQATIAERSEPTTLTLTKLWTCTELKKPGNILTWSDNEGESRILVHDGWRAVVELSATGRVKVRRDLDIPMEPEEAVVSYLRTALKPDGQRIFVGSASSQQRLFVFNEDFQKLLSWPDSQHAGISDVQLADLDGDGEVEINVGYWETVGVHNVSLTGERHWSNRKLENVLRLAATGASPSGRSRLLAASARGTLMAISADGADAVPIAVGGRFLRMVYSADLDGDERPEYCGIASEQLGVDVALGFTLEGTELWKHELPAGVQPNPALEMVTWGQLSAGGQGHWALAGADGSILLVAADGTLVDQFAYGKAISGLALARLGIRPVLLVASADGVDAWQISE